MSARRDDGGSSSLPAALERLEIDAGRLTTGIDELARFTDAPPPAVTRVLYTEQDRKARDWLADLAAEQGLSTHEDPIGNTFYRWEGEEPDLAAVATGSHVDAIPNAGRYDGVVGVLGGFEAVRALRDAGYRPRRSIDVVLFTSEEPTRFGIGCLGSRALAGLLRPGDLRALRDADGRGFDDVRREAGFSGELADVRLRDDHFHAFVELHIEQGPLLERDGLDIGVVTAIAAPATLHVRVEGEGGHAGAVAMRGRRDALAAAAEIVLAVEREVLATGSPDTVGTVGILDVHPRAVNSIPDRAFLTADVRDVDGERRDRVLSQIRAACARIEEERGVELSVETVNADPPATCSDVVRGAARAAAEAGRYAWREMISRAYHDALFMAQVCPTGMIFIPCRAGISHRPDEYASPDHVAAGTEVLARTLAALAS